MPYSCTHMATVGIKGFTTEIQCFLGRKILDIGYFALITVLVYCSCYWHVWLLEILSLCSARLFHN